MCMDGFWCREAIKCNYGGGVRWGRVLRRGRQEDERQEAEITAAVTTTKKIQTKP